MALCGVTGCETQRLHRHHGAAVQRQQFVGGAHKIHTGPTGQFAIGLELVLHDLGDRQLGQRLIQRLLQALDQARAFDHAVVKQRFSFAIGGTLKRRHSGSWVAHISTQSLQFLQQCWSGVAIGV